MRYRHYHRMANSNTATGCGSLLLFTFILGACSGLLPKSPTREQLEDARNRGKTAAIDSGLIQGEHDGYWKSHEAARSVSYNAKLSELIKQKKYRRPLLATTTVVLTFAIIGYVAQWIFLYILRVSGCFADIDWILLPKNLSTIELTKLPSPNSTASRILPSILFTAFVLQFASCKNPEDRAWQQGYEASRSTAYLEGWEKGSAAGKKIGAEVGILNAEAAAKNGTDASFYTTHAYSAFLFGVTIGLCLQYSLLAICGHTGSIPEFYLLLVVPAASRSLSYSIMLQQRRLLTWWQSQSARLQAEKQYKLAQLQAVQDIFIKKATVAQSIEEAGLRHILVLAQKEADAILGAEMDLTTAAQGPADHQSPSGKQVSAACPYCGRENKYAISESGKVATCIFDKCRRRIVLP